MQIRIKIEYESWKKKYYLVITVELEKFLLFSYYSENDLKNKKGMNGCNIPQIMLSIINKHQIKLYKSNAIEKIKVEFAIYNNLNSYIILPWNILTIYSCK